MNRPTEWEETDMGSEGHTHAQAAMHDMKPRTLGPTASEGWEPIGS